MSAFSSSFLIFLARCGWLVGGVVCVHLTYDGWLCRDLDLVIVEAKVVIYNCCFEWLARAAKHLELVP